MIQRSSRKKDSRQHRSKTGKERHPAESSRRADQAETGAKASIRQNLLKSYLMHHRKMARESLQRLLKQPISSLMTWMVIGIALALPTGLFVLLSNLQSMSSGWDGSAQITLFLKQDITKNQAKVLSLKLNRRTDIASVNFISREQALDEFKASSGFGDVLSYLTKNPLPNVIVVKLPSLLQGISQTKHLQQYLASLPEVKKAELDLQWVKRLYTMTQLLQRAVWVLSGFLALAVLLVIGNTIRLAIESRRDEILVVKLVGGTDSFVRRPFLYTGMWYGLGGGLITYILVSATLWWLNSPIQRLAELYYSSFKLNGLSFLTFLFLLLLSMLLGWSGAWLAVHRHLSDIEPH